MHPKPSPSSKHILPWEYKEQNPEYLTPVLRRGRYSSIPSDFNPTAETSSGNLYAFLWCEAAEMGSVSPSVMIQIISPWFRSDRKWASCYKLFLRTAVIGEVWWERRRASAMQTCPITGINSFFFPYRNTDMILGYDLSSCKPNCLYT